MCHEITTYYTECDCHLSARTRECEAFREAQRTGWTAELSRRCSNFWHAGPSQNVAYRNCRECEKRKQKEKERQERKEKEKKDKDKKGGSSRKDKGKGKAKA
jgi:hypothetical protein